MNHVEGTKQSEVEACSVNNEIGAHKVIRIEPIESIEVTTGLVGGSVVLK